MTRHAGREVIFEFIPRGRYVKVSAVDPITGIEASIVGDATAPQERLEELALQKLQYVMNKRSD